MNGIELFRKLQSGEMKLEAAKELQNIFQSNLNEISKGRLESKQQESPLENTNCFTNHDKLFM